MASRAMRQTAARRKDRAEIERLIRLADDLTQRVKAAEAKAAIVDRLMADKERLTDAAELGVLVTWPVLIAMAGVLRQVKNGTVNATLVQDAVAVLDQLDRAAAASVGLDADVPMGDWQQAGLSVGLLPWVRS